MERPNLKICFENDDNSDSDDDKPIVDFEAGDSHSDAEIGEKDDDQSQLRRSQSPTSPSRSRSRSSRAGSSRSRRSSSSSSSSSSSGSGSDSESDSASDTGRSKGSEPITEATLEVAMDTGDKMMDTKRYHNRAGEFITGFDTLSKEEQQKREERAKRFGTKSTVPDVPVADVEELYQSLGITSKDVTSGDSGERGIRLEAIHIRGVDEMSTKDVFKYFEEYGPGALEWIDDTSCNVVWIEASSAARALLSLSSEINQAETSKRDSKNKPWRRKKGTQKETGDSSSSSGDEETMEVEKGVLSRESSTDKAAEEIVEKHTDVEKMEEEDDFDYNLNLMSDEEDSGKNEPSKAKSLTSTSKEKSPEAVKAKVQKDKSDSEHEVEQSHRNLEQLPPGKWRKGIPFPPKATSLYLRYATRADKKTPGAEKRSKYYQKYGNPNFHGMKGLISGSRKRKMRASAYREELATAKKIVAKSKKISGIPDETAFDLHTKAAEQQKSKAGRLRGWSDEDESMSDSDARQASKRQASKTGDKESDVEEELRAMLEIPPQSPPQRNPNICTAQELVPQRVPEIPQLAAGRSNSVAKIIHRRLESSDSASEGEISHYSSENDSDQNIETDVDTELRAMLEIPPESPPVKKRFMKMYADEVEEQQHKRASSSDKMSGVHKRLSSNINQVRDARSKISGRPQDNYHSSDLRNRLGRKRQHQGNLRMDSSRISGVPSLTIQVEPD